VCVAIAQGLVLEFSFVNTVEFVQRFKSYGERETDDIRTGLSFVIYKEGLKVR
jgi:hypothetical protein